MNKYGDIRYLRSEEEAIDLIIRKLYEHVADTSASNKDKALAVIAMLEDHKAACVEKYTALERSLQAIRNDDPEVYVLIVYHDLQGLTWQAAFNKACQGLRSADGAEYARKRVSRYLTNKQEGGEK